MTHAIPRAQHAPHQPRPAKKPAPHKSGHGGLAAGIVAGLMAGVAALYFALVPATHRADPTKALLAQMQAAATGAAPATHAFGGRLSVTLGDGPANVTAENLPAKACVQVGWRLSKDGTVIVNGVLPQRLSAARLSELCASEGGATLTWVPDAE